MNKLPYVALSAMDGYFALLTQQKKGGLSLVDRLSPTDVNYLSQPGAFSYEERERVVASLSSVIYGVAQAQGISEVQVPAEVVAVAIFRLVSPVNYMACSQWASALHQSHVEKAVSDQGTVDYEKVSPNRLYAMVILFAGHRSELLNDSYEDKMKASLEKLGL
jgi:hypothetical protein